MISIASAEGLAREAHKNQRTTLGDLRVDHVMRVANQVSAGGDELTIVAAILHDAVEKGELRWDDLVAAGAEPELIEILDRLTEREDEPEAAYLDRCGSHPVARCVKQADLLDKLREGAGGSLPAEERERIRQHAVRRLEILNSERVSRDHVDRS